MLYEAITRTLWQLLQNTNYLIYQNLIKKRKITNFYTKGLSFIWWSSTKVAREIHNRQKGQYSNEDFAATALCAMRYGTAREMRNRHMDACVVFGKIRGKNTETSLRLLQFGKKRGNIDRTVSNKLMLNVVAQS